MANHTAIWELSSDVAIYEPVSNNWMCYGKSRTKKLTLPFTVNFTFLLFVNSWMLVLWVKFSAGDILKYVSYSSQRTSFGISCNLSPLETVSMKCQILFSGKNKKKYNQCVVCWIAQRVVKVKQDRKSFKKICQTRWDVQKWHFWKERVKHSILVESVLPPGVVTLLTIPIRY